jgi:V/A-type H+-transporting ATPase subunit I
MSAAGIDARPLGRLQAALRGLLLPAPVVRIGLFFLSDNLPDVISVLGRLRICHINRQPSPLKEYLEPYFPEAFRSAYQQLREPYEALAQRWHLTGAAELATAARQIPSISVMLRLTEELTRCRQQVNAFDEQQRELEQRQEQLTQFAYYLRALATLEVDFTTLAELRFLHVRAGTVPLENLQRLQESARLAEDLVLSIGTQQDRAFVLVLGAGSISADLEGLLTKAHFVPLPQQVAPATRRSESIAPQLDAEAQAIREQLRAIERKIAHLCERAKPVVLEGAAVLAQAAVLIECDGALESRAPLAFLRGWVPADRLSELEQTLLREVPTPVVLVREPATDSQEQGPPPSVLRVPTLFLPGAVLVRLFGVPAPDELNPALILAITAPFLFGMMFGDLGQSSLIIGLALAFRRRVGPWLAPLVACGMSSFVFGLLYGSIFGMEEWLPALWLRPLKEPFRLLTASLTVGVAFLLLTFMLKAVNLVLQRQWQQALLSFQGGAGAVCYLSAIWLVKDFSRGESVHAPELILLVTGLVMLGLGAVHEIRVTGLSALTQLGTELFHGGLSLITNTLSFLRLAAFALNHGALSLALFLVADAIPRTPVGWLARGLVLVVGTVVILVLDLLVVGVQTIRLEFYEGLTRYYRGDGKEFLPLRFRGTAPN